MNKIVINSLIAIPASSPTFVLPCLKCFYLIHSLFHSKSKLSSLVLQLTTKIIELTIYWQSSARSNFLFFGLIEKYSNCYVVFYFSLTMKSFSLHMYFIHISIEMSRNDFYFRQYFFFPELQFKFLFHCTSVLTLLWTQELKYFGCDRNLIKKSFKKNPTFTYPL